MDNEELMVRAIADISPGGTPWQLKKAWYIAGLIDVEAEYSAADVSQVEWFAILCDLFEQEPPNVDR
jgi:hypothetical protein